MLLAAGAAASRAQDGPAGEGEGGTLAHDVPAADRPATATGGREVSGERQASSSREGLTPPDGDQAREARPAPSPDGDDEEGDDGKLTPDPYAPLGLRAGSFLVLPQIEVASEYTDNVFLSSQAPQSDRALALMPALTLLSNWSRHELAVELRARQTTHDRFSSEDENAYSALLRGRLDASERTKIGGELSHELAQEDRSSVDFPDNAAGRTDVTTDRAAIEGSHRFNRLTVSLRGSVTETSYGDVATADGGILSGETRDNRLHETGARAAYEFTPGISAFLDASVNDRQFERSTDDAGNPTGSHGYVAQAGLAFELTGKLTGEASMGYARQTPNDAALAPIAGVIFNADLTWRATGLTTVRFNAESSVDSSARVLTRSYGVALEHALRRNLLLGAEFVFSTDSDFDTDEVTKNWDASLSAEYLFNRMVGLKGEYTYSLSDGPRAGDGYTVNAATVALTLRR